MHAQNALVGGIIWVQYLDGSGPMRVLHSSFLIACFPRCHTATSYRARAVYGFHAKVGKRVKCVGPLCATVYHCVVYAVSRLPDLWRSNIVIQSYTATITITINQSFNTTSTHSRTEEHYYRSLCPIFLLALPTLLCNYHVTSTILLNQ